MISHCKFTLKKKTIVKQKQILQGVSSLGLKQWRFPLQA